MRRNHSPARFTLALVIAFLSGCAAVAPAPGTLRDADHPLAGRLWDVASQRFIEPAELLSRAAAAEAILLGETHDNSEHHRLQGVVLKARLAAGARPALLMEQFDVDQQAALDEARNGGKDLAPLMRGWDWPLYEPIIAVSREAKLHLAAANLPRAKLRPIVREGYASLPAGEEERLALGAVWDEPREKYMSALIEESHCGMITPELRAGLIRAQRLRDATMADAALRNLDGGLFFILGRGHARRDVGVPRYLEARRPGTRILSVGFIEVSNKKTRPTEYESDGVGGAPTFDILWFTPRAERADPCLNFGK